MPWHCCLFEANSIQRYILRSGRLRHIVGGSEVIASLDGRLLDDALDALDLHPGGNVLFGRRAGGAMHLYTRDAAVCSAFRDLWSLLVPQYAPMLDFAMGIGSGPDAWSAREAARAALERNQRHRAPQLPVPGPLTQLAARTGQPAMARDGKLGEQDAATARFGRDEFSRGALLARRFDPGSAPEDWPRNLEPDEDDPLGFPFRADNRYLGLVHADGNGLGQMLLSLSRVQWQDSVRFVEGFLALSRAIGDATERAARTATAAVLRPAAGDGLMPARPIVLGGDDLTLLVRADLALPFTASFLRAFEAETAAGLRALRERIPEFEALPQALTAGAGIAFVRSSHPFHLAHDLAASLAEHAKSHAKRHVRGGRIPPTVAFHRVTASTHGEYPEILASEMRADIDGEPVQTTLGVYGLDDDPVAAPPLAALQELARLFDEPGRGQGRVRQLLTLMGQASTDTRERYQRWRVVMNERDPQWLRRFDAAFARCCPQAETGLAVGRLEDGLRATPLGDVITLLSVGLPESGPRAELETQP